MKLLKTLLIFGKNDGGFSNLIFSDYYKKKTIKIHLFTIFRAVTDWLQNGYKIRTGEKRHTIFVQENTQNVNI